MKILLSVIFVAAFVSTAFSDIANPGRQKREIPKTWNGQMSINTRADVGIATLKIRKDKLKQLRAAIDQADDQQNTAAVQNGTTGRGQTIVAGILLSIAMVMGGFVIFRRSDRVSKVALSIAAVSVVGIGAVVVFANTPPPSIVGLTSRIFDKSVKNYGYAEGQIAIQVVDDKYMTDDVTLEIPAVGDDKRSE